MRKIELKKRPRYIDISVEFAKMIVLVAVTLAIGFPLMIKALEWFAGLWGYTI